jgi:hypothetical protein
LEPEIGIFVALSRLQELKKAGVASCVMKILKPVKILRRRKILKMNKCVKRENANMMFDRYFHEVEKMHKAGECDDRMLQLVLDMKQAFFELPTFFPVDVGDKVWYIHGGYYNSAHQEPREIEVTEINKKKSGKTIDWGFIANRTRYKFSSIGKTVFLTKEDCLAAINSKKAKNYKQHIV